MAKFGPYLIDHCQISVKSGSPWQTLAEFGPHLGPLSNSSTTFEQLPGTHRTNFPQIQFGVTESSLPVPASPGKPSRQRAVAGGVIPDPQWGQPHTRCVRSAGGSSAMGRLWATPQILRCESSLETCPGEGGGDGDKILKTYPQTSTYSPQCQSVDGRPENTHIETYSWEHFWGASSSPNAKFGQHFANLGQIWPAPGQSWPSLVQCWPTLSNTCGRNLRPVREHCVLKACFQYRSSNFGMFRASVQRPARLRVCL